MDGVDLTVIQPYIDKHPWPPMFLTMSGAHLYGFASPDSDYDVRGAHVTSAEAMLGLRKPRQTYDVLDRDAAVEVDLVTHDVRKFFRMLLGRNGYVLEQVCSPLIVFATAAFDELRSLVPGFLTRHHRHHFRSFATHQWQSVAGPAGGTVKGLLYTYRPLLAGIHLMTERRVESNLRTLNERFRLPYIDELIQAKVTGAEKQKLGDTDMAFHESEFDRLNAELDEAAERSGLPEAPAATEAVNDLLIRLRLARFES